MTNCKTFCRYRCPFFLLPPLPPCFFVFFFCCSPQTSPLLPPASYLALQSLNTLALPFFFSFSCLLALLFFLHFSRAGVSCAVSRAAATNQVPHSSRVISVTQSWKTCTLLSSPLSPLTATSPLHHRTSRSDRNWAK